MKNTKYAVLGLTVVAMVAVFLDWISIGGESAALFGRGMPRTGMDNGGPVFLFFLAMPLLGSGIGALKRYGRGLAALSLIGAFLATFLGLVKYSDIDAAAREAKTIGATVEAGAGYWLFFASACAICLLSLAALIKPEKRASAPALGGPQALAPQPYP